MQISYEMVSNAYVRQLTVPLIFQGNYQESLNDAKAATKLQPTYIKAIARGKAWYFMKLNVIYTSQWPHSQRT